METKVSKMIEEAVAKLWKLGIQSNAAIMQPRSARQLSEEFGDSMIQPRTTINDEGRIVVLPDNHPSFKGGKEITVLHTPYGEIKILTSIYCPPETIYVGDEEQLQSYHDRSEAMYRENTDFEYPT
jgi:hypothetical protein